MQKTKRDAVKSDLAPTTNPVGTELTELKQAVTPLMVTLAGAVKAALGTPAAAGLYTAVETWAKNLTTLQDLLKQSLKQQVLKEGKVTNPDTGSKEATVGGYHVHLTARGKDAYDDKKVEALLRANKVDLDRYMRKTITYTIDPEKLAALREAGWGEALETCKKDVVYALMPPKPVSEVE